MNNSVIMKNYKSFEISLNSFTSVFIHTDECCKESNRYVTI